MLIMLHYIMISIARYALGICYRYGLNGTIRYCYYKY